MYIASIDERGKRKGSKEKLDQIIIYQFLTYDILICIIYYSETLASFKIRNTKKFLSFFRIFTNASFIIYHINSPSYYYK